MTKVNLNINASENQRNPVNPNKRKKIDHNSEEAVSTNRHVHSDNASEDEDNLRHKKPKVNSNQVEQKKHNSVGFDSSLEETCDFDQLKVTETKIYCPEKALVVKAIGEKDAGVEQQINQLMDENIIFEDWMEDWEDFDFTNWSENESKANHIESPRDRVRKLEVFQVQFGHYFSQGTTKNEKVVTLIDENGDFCYLHLREDWLETSICDGNVVNVLGKFDDDSK
ncbi:8489_t:CDS:2, partial [Acaulospora morrowiae]